MSEIKNYSEIKAFIFDLDGTLFDTSVFIEAAKEALKIHGYTFTSQQIKEVFGQKVKKAISDLIRKKEGKRKLEIEKINETFDKLCVGEYLDKVRPRPNLKRTFKKMKEMGYKLAIVTNNDRIILDAILKRFGLKKYLSSSISGDDGFEKKEDAILYLVRELSISPKELCYIGDMPKDIKIARKVGCKIFSIPFLIPEEKLKKERPDKIIYSIEELIKDLNYQKSQ
ncbi:MAG: HAD family hydrolase [Candidatus Aenigmatarchaeota archaeon]